MGKLEGKIALITGGNGGIGLATAKQFVNEGAYVFITGRRAPELAAGVKEIGRNVTGVPGDMSNLGDLDRLFAQIKREKGKLDIVFANAGVAKYAPLGTITEEFYDSIFDINVKGLLFTVQKALPLMPDGASIILNASIVGSKGLPANSVYAATKAAVRSFARTWTTDLKARRIRALLEAPIAPTLLRLAVPNMLVLVAQAAAGLIETYFIGKLGTDALAGVALVFPVVMLMQMMSAGAMGGGISSSIARALGAARRADADALALHALVIALGFGGAFMIAVLGGGRSLYRMMGGSGASLDAALTYSNWVFAGAVLVWLFNSLAAVIRGTGNMALPAAVTCVGVALLVPLSPALIFGWGPFPALRIARGAVALVSYYALGCVALGAYLWSGRSVVRPSLRTVRFRWPLFRDILRVGAVAALVTVATNLTIMIGTAFAGEFGPAAIAGYGTGARLEYLLVPLVFGLGGPLVAMVGTSIGAGQP